MEHRALYGVSTSGNTEFAIVRTGSYIQYGFGGFVYQRSGGVVLPQEGQATYSGDYGGIRDFSGAGGLEYVTGDMTVDVDFKGFRNNCSGATCADAIRGVVSNRKFFDVDGGDRTAGYITALNDDRPTGAAPVTEVPTIRFEVGPNVMDGNGEATGNAFSTAFGDQLDEGNYYIVLSGDHTAGDGGEIVGVVVVESDDPRFTDVTVRETGGFILER
ncbi:hypothetical protein [Lacimonas salitolerans]|uniref:Uncharacterized protein n=1 Tax=Lacimonas salitolerans TaxID=1323750 RepID=A0ABW4EHK0_9RHOB